MDLLDLKTGTRLELHPCSDEEGEKISYVSRLEWVADENTAVIDAPILKRNIVPLQPGSMFDIFFTYRKKKQLVNLYKFRAVVKERMIIDNLHLIAVEKAGEMVRVQRREYFRLDCFLKVRYRVVESFGKSDDIVPFKQTIAKDLSGGGICLLLTEKLKPGTLVECEILGILPENIKCMGRAVRYDNIHNAGRYKYTVGIAFDEINDSEREAVIRYVFREQRKLLRKGLDQ